MTTARDDLVRHELKTSLASTDGAGSTFEVLFSVNPFREIPDPGSGNARALLTDNDDPKAATKWELVTISARAANGGGDGYVLTINARNENSNDGNAQDFSAGDILLQVPNTFDLKEFLALSGGTMTGALNMGGNAVNGVGNRTGVDANLVSGTKGANGNVANWNVDGDLVDAGFGAANVALKNADNNFSATQTINGSVLLNGISPKVAFNESDTTDLNAWFNLDVSKLNLERRNDDGNLSAVLVEVNVSTGAATFNSYLDATPTADLLYRMGGTDLGLGRSSGGDLVGVFKTGREFQVKENSRTSGALFAVSSSYAWIGSALNFGIGTSTPTASLELKGGGLSSRIRFNNTVALSDWDVTALDGGDFTLSASGSGSVEMKLSPGGGVIFADSTNADGLRMYSGGAVTIGAPTGASQGKGTLNAEAVYDDGTLLTDYVLDAELDGGVDLTKWDAAVPNRERVVQEETEEKEVEEIITQRRAVVKEEWDETKQAYIRRPVQQDVPVMEEVPVLDDAGNPVMEEVPVLDEEGNETGETENVPVTRQRKKTRKVRKPAQERQVEIEERTHGPARRFADNLDELDPASYWAKVAATRKLPAIDRAEQEALANGAKGPSLGESLQAIVETCEVQAVLIEKQRKKIEDLEARVSALET